MKEHLHELAGDQQQPKQGVFKVFKGLSHENNPLLKEA